MDIGIKLLNPVSNCTRIRNCIDDYVAGIYPFDLQIGWFMGDIDYLYPDKPDDDSTGFISFNAKNGGDRMKLKTARYLTRKCGLNKHLNDEQIRILAEKINSLLWTEEELNNVEILRGQAIMDAYEEEVGGSSCMTGDCSCYTGLYVENPNRFGMLVIRNGNDSARAIVHYLDNGRTLLGCVYTTAEHLLDKMRDYGIQQGWHIYRDLTDIDKSTLIMSGLNFCEGEIPYMDVLIQGEICGDTLTASYNGGSFSLQDQNGGLGGYTCEACGDHVHEDDTYRDNGGEAYCETCFNEIFFICYHCNDTVCNDDGIFIENKEIYVCQSCADQNYHQCKTCSDYHELDNVQFLNDDAYCESCFDEIADCCEECSEAFYTKDLTTVDDSGPLCEDCAITIKEAKGAIL